MDGDEHTEDETAEPEAARFELLPGEQGALEPEPQELEPPKPSEADLRLSKRVGRARFLAIAAWGVALFLGKQNVEVTSRWLAGESLNVGYAVDQILYVGIPLGLALMALWDARPGLRSNASDDRSKARLALGLSGAYLALLLLIVGIGGVLLAQGKIGAVRVERPARAGAAMSEAEVRAFGERVEAEINGRSAQFVVDRCDRETLTYLIFEGHALPAAFLRGWHKSPMISEEPWTTLFTRLDQGQASFELIHLDASAKPPRVVFRILSEEGVNYQELLLVRGGDGQVSWSDLYTYMGSSRLSETMRNLVLDAEGKVRKGSSETQLMVKQIARQDWQGVLDAYRKLPPGEQRRKEVLLVRMRAAQELGDEQEYLAVIEAFRAFETDGRDPGLGLTLYDSHYERKDWARCARILDELFAAVRDPYLHSLRGYQLLDMGDLEAAELAARKAVGEEPEHEHGYVTLLTVALAGDDHATTAAMLTHLEQNFGYDYRPWVDAEADYAAFKASPEGKAWLAARPLEEGD